MASSDVSDVIVVGAGIEGSAAAYSIASHGKKVLLLEQFDATHTRGSSHGPSRITRRAYEKDFYVRLMDEAFVLWKRLEEEAGIKLYHQTGVLYCGKESDVEPVINSLSAAGVPHKVLSGAEVNEKYSDQLNLPHDNVCVWEDDGGILVASKAIAAYQKLFIGKGGTLIDQCKVLNICPGNVVVVTTTKGQFLARKIIIAAGAWSPVILKELGLDLPFQIMRPEVYYWKVENPSAFSSTKFPVFIIHASILDGEEFYGIPSHEYPGCIKISPHFGPIISSPDERDTCGTATLQELTASFVAKYFKGVSTKPCIYDGCLYTNTPDRNPVLDKHPSHSNIIIGTGFSGHGFKLSPVVGKILCELTLELPLSYDLSHFCISRLVKN